MRKINHTLIPHGKYGRKDRTMILKTNRKRYRQVISALSLFGSFVILLTTYISSVYAAPDTEVLLAAGNDSGVIMTEVTPANPAHTASEPDNFENRPLEASPVILISEIEDVVAETFEKQDARMYVDDVMYSGRISLQGDTYYVGIADFASAVSPGAVISESGGHIEVETDKVYLSAYSGGVFFVANGRYLWCRDGIITEEGEIMAPLSILCRVFGASRADSDSPLIVTSGDAVIESGGAYYNSDSLYWLSRIISAESKGESLYGKIAVGNVVLNRVREPDYPNTIYDVIFDDSSGVQFSPVANGTIENEPDDDSIAAAKLCLEGVSVSKNILYFLNPDVADNFWIVNNRTYVTTIGNHEFYS